MPEPTRPTPLGGRCDPAFRAVEDAFADNFSQRGETGAGVCVAVDGRTVVDLWGGHADANGARPWAADTLVNIFSIGKGLSAAVVARLVGDGLLDVEAPVARFWPDFAAGGKADVTVRQLVSHQAGLPAVRRLLPETAMLRHDVMASALAEQEPWWPPGSTHGYHTNTFGFLVGELVRRVAGVSLGAYLRDHIAGPLEADVHIGLPASEDARVAEFIGFEAPPPSPEPAGLTESELMEHHAYFNPPGLSGAGLLNTREWRAAEIPSTNGHGSARGVARVYRALAAGGSVDGIRIVDTAALAAATDEEVYGDDAVLHRPTRFGLGFQLTQPERPLGPNLGAFGHFGAGGSLGFCDPDAGVAFGYVMNQIGPSWQNPRNRALVDAVYESLA